ncbi:MAG: biotin transporter BioY [Parachlamydiales bacterium]|nr:biotin transporter BioY [Parachlamydiales bacterium]
MTILTLRFSKIHYMQEVLFCCLLAVAMGLTAKVSVPLPFTPVPVVVQNFFPLFIAIFFGWKRAFFTTAAWFLFGMMGLPFFAGNFFTLGYRLGYIASAAVSGWVFERTSRNAWHAFGSMVLGSWVIYLWGILWLLCYFPFSRVMLLGILPFIPLDMLKAFLCASIYRTYRKDSL